MRYIIHCVDGEVVPVESKIKIKSIKIASIFAHKDALSFKECDLRDYIMYQKLKEMGLNNVMPSKRT